MHKWTIAYLFSEGIFLLAHRQYALLLQAKLLTLYNSPELQVASVEQYMGNTSKQKLKSLSVRLSPELVNLIKFSARERSQTQAELIADSVQYYLQYKEQDVEGTNSVLQDVLQDVLREREARIALLEDQLKKSEERERNATAKANYLSLPWLIRVMRGPQLLPPPRN